MENTEKELNSTPKPTRQAPSWLKAILRWAVIILVAFASGAVLVVLAFYLPLRQDYRQVSEELDVTTDEVIDLSDQVTDLTNQVSELTSSTESLQQSLDDANLQQAIISALADERATRLAILTDDLAGARLAITQAIQSLDMVNDLIEKENSDIVNDMLNKADQANTDLQRDMTSALPALKLLDTNLLLLSETLFSAP